MPCIEPSWRWRGYELIRGALEPTAGSVAFLHATAAWEAAAKVTTPRGAQLNTRAKDERALFVLASEAVVEGTTTFASSANATEVDGAAPDADDADQAAAVRAFITSKPSRCA